MASFKQPDAKLSALIAQLQDGHYHNGQMLGTALKLSRCAIWKRIKTLKAYGVHLIATKNKGYRLLEPLILLNIEAIQKNLIHPSVEFICFECIDSTNDYLKRTTHLHPLNVLCCLAEQQSAGRGRFNHTWYSPFAKNIYLSCSFIFQKDVSTLSGLSLVTSLAIAKTLQAFGIRQKLFIKWPNDIIYDDKKLCGNLIDIQAESNGQSRAIIGIGINVNLCADPQQHISQPWTSMHKILGHSFDRNTVISTLLNHLITDVELFAEEGFSIFLNDWEPFDYLYRQSIEVIIHQQSFLGTAMGINEQGYLRLVSNQGKTILLSSGDARLLRMSLISQKKR